MRHRGLGEAVHREAVGTGRIECDDDDAERGFGRLMESAPPDSGNRCGRTDHQDYDARANRT